MANYSLEDVNDIYVDVLKEIGYKNVTNKLYEKYRHEILNEVDNDKIYLDIIEFISK